MRYITKKELLTYNIFSVLVQSEGICISINQTAKVKVSLENFHFCLGKKWMLKNAVLFDHPVTSVLNPSVPFKMCNTYNIVFSLVA